jgi:hypothetical protein
VTPCFRFGARAPGDGLSRRLGARPNAPPDSRIGAPRRHEAPQKVSGTSCRTAYSESPLHWVGRRKELSPNPGGGCQTVGMEPAALPRHPAAQQLAVRPPEPGETWPLTDVYVELVWAHRLGPSATLAARHIGRHLERYPNGGTLNLDTLAKSIGHGPTRRRHRRLDVTQPSSTRSNASHTSASSNGHQTTQRSPHQARRAACPDLNFATLRQPCSSCTMRSSPRRQVSISNPRHSSNGRPVGFSRRRPNERSKGRPGAHADLSDAANPQPRALYRTGSRRNQVGKHDNHQ